MALSGDEAATWIDAARLALALVCLAVASLTDLRTRTVPNRLWYLTAAVGVGLLAVDLSRVEDANAWHLALAFPVAAVFMVTITGGELWPVFPEDEEDEDRELTPEEERVYKADLAVSLVLIVASVAVLVLAHGRVEDRTPYWHVVSSVAIIGLALAFYLARLLHGGGDAKALMTLAVLFPVHPLGDGLPLLEVPVGMELLFPFALAVVINAAIITALSPIAFVAISASRGPLSFPEALFGYPVAIDAVRDGRMWLLHEMGEADAEPGRRLWPRRSKAAEAARERALRHFEERGDASVYVSPKLPFMVPMLVGLVLAAVVGNIVTGLMWALIGP